jgi:hypothetical protein
VSSTRCYCPFCKIERRVYLKKHISIIDLIFCLLLAGMVSFAAKQTLDPRALIVFVVASAMLEMLIQLRRRISLVCSRCGFDPVIYSRDHGLAAQLVKTHLEERQNDPNYLLFPKPKLTPVLKKKQPDKPKETLLSRRV